MLQLSRPIRSFPGFVHRATSDSLIRNSLYLMTSTVMTAGLGYIFWAVAAHVFTRQEVGIGGAVISLCSTVALLTYLGSSAMLIELLPASEGSSRWTTVLTRVCAATAGVTAIVTVAAVPVLLTSPNYRSFFSSATPILLAVLGAAAWTLVNLFCSAFIAARRAGGFLSIQTLVSVAKVLFILPLAIIGAGADGLVGAWTGSAILGVGVGAVWLIPRMRLGGRPSHRPRRGATAVAAAADERLGPYRRPRHRRPHAPPGAAYTRHVLYMRRLLGQHLTSVGGAVTPLVLPVLVVLRLGATPNAYFYITWLLGGIFFTVSPSVAAALFAEGVRVRSNLRSVVTRALRVISIMLAPAIVVMIVGGRLILGIFGASYAAAGYELLILLAISALPDAVSNVAVAVLRVTNRLGYSAALNLGILVVTLVGAWFLMPPLGIAGVGVTWLAAQILGAIASLPAYAQIGERVTT
jgi:O-antigen/teichoic acid export membrane protein